MKSLFFINDTLENKISYYHLAGFVIALPFDRFYCEIILISFLLHTLIHLKIPGLRRAITYRNLIIISVFLITAVGILYSPDKTQALKDLQRQLAIIIFPLLLSISLLDLEKYKMNFLQLFSFSCVITILYLYLDATRIMIYNKLPLSRLFTEAFVNQNFSSPVQIHATYLGMFCLLSAVILLYSLLVEINNSRRILYLLSLLVLLAGLVQLGSRSVLISAILIAVIFPFVMPKGVNRLQLILVMTVTGILITLIVINSSSLKTRYVAQFKDDLTEAPVEDVIAEPRIVRWRLALQLIEKSPLVGYGSGSEKRLLNELYFKNKLYNSYLHQLNAHNQYLSIALKTGIWGLVIFLFTLIFAFVTAFRNRDILFGSFLVIISIVSFSENILDVNKGIFFYAFFFSLFIYSGKPFERLFRFNSRKDPQGLSMTGK